MSGVHVIPMQLAYKGERDYLHGTDMYDAAMGQLQRLVPGKARGRLNMVIHGFSRNQCDLVYAAAALTCPKPERARVELSLSGGVFAWLAETDRPVTQRRPYAEQEIAAAGRIDGAAIVAGRPGRYSAIEVLVALTKELHLALRGRQTKWAFTRLELERPLEHGDAAGLHVELVHALGDRLTKCTIRVSGRELGYIYFSAIRS